MAKNDFGGRLSELLKLAGIKSVTLAGDLRYDVSYISKWISGKMLPSEKTIDFILDGITGCLLKGDRQRLLQEYDCREADLYSVLREDLMKRYENCRPVKQEMTFSPLLPLAELVEQVDRKVTDAASVEVVADILSLPHESRLILAGIKNGHFAVKAKGVSYSMVLCAESADPVYDSIFMIHMLTSMSCLDFKLYNNRAAMGKMIVCADQEAYTAILLPESKECLAVNALADGKKIRQSIQPLMDQENLIFRKTSIADMIRHREYIQCMISTHIRWILGHACELLLPQDVFEELLEEQIQDDKDNFRKLYRLSQSLILSGKAKLMIYESVIADLAVDGIVDFYNKPVQLNEGQALRCLTYYEELVSEETRIRLIDGGFSEDFRYITNPCMFLSDSLCYVRLENKRYEDNILILNDRAVKGIFVSFFAAVWSERRDVVLEDQRLIREKISHYRKSAEILLDMGRDGETEPLMKSN